MSSAFETFLGAMNIPKDKIFLVGSRAYDGAYPHYKASMSGSDWDYIVTLAVAQDIKANLLYKQSILPEDSEYNNGFKFVYDGKQINIIPLIDVEWNAWRWATESLKTWANHDHYIRIALKGKFSRIALLEQQRACYKSALAMGAALS